MRSVATIIAQSAEKRKSGSGNSYANLASWKLFAFFHYIVFARLLQDIPQIYSFEVSLSIL